MPPITPSFVTVGKGRGRGGKRWESSYPWVLLSRQTRLGNWFSPAAVAGVLPEVVAGQERRRNQPAEQVGRDVLLELARSTRPTKEPPGVPLKGKPTPDFRDPVPLNSENCPSQEDPKPQAPAVHWWVNRIGLESTTLHASPLVAGVAPPPGKHPNVHKVTAILNRHGTQHVFMGVFCILKQESEMLSGTQTTMEHSMQ